MIELENAARDFEALLDAHVANGGKLTPEWAKPYKALKAALALRGAKPPAGLDTSQLKLGIRHPRHLRSGDDGD